MPSTKRMVAEPEQNKGGFETGVIRVHLNSPKLNPPRVMPLIHQLCTNNPEFYGNPTLQ